MDAHYLSPLEAGLLVSDEPGNAQVLPEALRLIIYQNRRRSFALAPSPPKKQSR